MSLRPRFADAILDGSKTVELRRTRVSAVPGTLIVIYASAPVMSVVGVATLDAVDIDRPAALWRRHKRELGLTRQEFDAYLEGAEIACGLQVREPRVLEEPYPLSWLRGHAGFQPPQSYRYLADLDPEPLHALTRAHG
ncbi:putative transcriptional regulator, contains an HTH and PUA-like domains [Lentzea aerocolonigenes]|nr:putative transcriptional regulator, contains an HTH and PUA-like domains [Lentzea aerocolonigenes]